MSETARIEEIRQRAEAATPGPWVWKQKLWPSERLTGLSSTTAFYEEYPGVPRSVLNQLDYMHEVDAAFIAEAREDIPWLLAALAALRTRLGEQTADGQTLKQACDAAAWEQDHGGCDCRACTVLMGAALEAVTAAALSQAERAGQPGPFGAAEPLTSRSREGEAGR